MTGEFTKMFNPTENNIFMPIFNEVRKTVSQEEEFSAFSILSNAGLDTDTVTPQFVEGVIMTYLRFSRDVKYTAKTVQDKFASYILYSPAPKAEKGIVWVDVNSTWIRKIGYDYFKCRLYTTCLKNDVEITYFFPDEIDLETWEDYKNASSKGKFFKMLEHEKGKGVKAVL